MFFSGSYQIRLNLILSQCPIFGKYTGWNVIMERNYKLINYIFFQRYINFNELFSEKKTHHIDVR